MEDVGVFHEKALSRGPYSFQPFNLPLQMHVVTRVNLPILTSNYIFPNRECLERFLKVVILVVAPFEAKKKQPWKKVA
jgi:hypothetical protein